MNPRTPLHSVIHFRFFGHDRKGLVAGEVGGHHDPVVAFRMKTDNAPRLVRIRMRGNVTRLGRGDLKSVLIDPKYFGIAREILLEEVSLLSSSIETQEALKEADRLTAIDVPGNDWSLIEPDKYYTKGQRRRRLDQVEVSGRAHEDDSDVECVILTEYEYDTDLGTTTSTSRAIIRTQAYYDKLLLRLGRDHRLLSARLMRFSR